jgi:hypothetical protein
VNSIGFKPNPRPLAALPHLTDNGGTGLHPGEELEPHEFGARGL